MEKKLLTLKKNNEKVQPKKTFQKRKVTNEKKVEEDIIIENITNNLKDKSKNESESKSNILINEQAPVDNEFNELLDLISKLTELQHYSVYSDSKERIEKEYPFIKYEYFYRTEYKDKESYTDQEFGPFDYESVTNWADNVNIYIIENRIF